MNEVKGGKGIKDGIKDSSMNNEVTGTPVEMETKEKQASEKQCKCTDAELIMIRSRMQV